MIHDHRALDPDAQPDVVLHREGEFDAIATALDPPSGLAPTPVFLFGPTGAGKTTVAREALERAEASMVDLETAYVACADQSRAAILRKLVEEIVGPQAVYPSKGAAELKADLEDWDTDMLVVLDEVDQADDHTVLRDVYDLRDAMSIQIANDEEMLFSQVGDESPLGSRLSGRRNIYFDAYTHDEIRDILDRRVATGLDGDRVAETALERIVTLAGGDARAAIAILQASARAVAAGDVDSETITPGVVETAAPAAAENLLAQALRRLNDDHEQAYRVLADAGESLRPGEWHDRYSDAVDDPVSRRTFTDYIQKLDAYRLVTDNGKATSRKKYRPRDPI
jgi:Cdc6-like AAA superfamily ATPase